MTSPASLLRTNTTQNIAQSLQNPGGLLGPPIQDPPPGARVPPMGQGFTYAQLMQSANRDPVTGLPLPEPTGQRPLPWQTVPPNQGAYQNPSQVHVSQAQPLPPPDIPPLGGSDIPPLPVPVPQNPNPPAYGPPNQDEEYTGPVFADQPGHIYADPIYPGGGGPSNEYTYDPNSGEHRYIPGSGGPQVELNPGQGNPDPTLEGNPSGTEPDPGPTGGVPEEPWYGRLARYLPYIGPFARLGHVAGNIMRANDPHYPFAHTNASDPTQPAWFQAGYQNPQGIQDAINRGDYQTAYTTSPSSAANAFQMWAAQAGRGQRNVNNNTGGDVGHTVFNPVRAAGVQPTYASLQSLYPNGISTGVDPNTGLPVGSINYGRG